jgi:hypothetical protein
MNQQQQKQRLSEIRQRAKRGGEGYFTPGGMNRTLASLDIDVLLERIDDLEAAIAERVEQAKRAGS